MSGRSAWTAGNGVGLTWTTAINSADLASMANGYTVLSTVADIANGTQLDMFADISVRLVITSSALALGATLSLWLYPLLDDGSTYGDGQLTAGSQAAVTPAFTPLPSIDLPVITTANLRGMLIGVMIPPGSFRLALQNNSGYSLTSGTQTVKYRTYNVNNNN